MTASLDRAENAARPAVPAVEKAESDTALTQPAPTPAQTVAQELHRVLCRWDHTQDCGWYYQAPDWAYGSYREYLILAEKALLVTDADTIIALMHTLRAPANTEQPC